MDRLSPLAWHVLACVASDTGDVATSQRAQSAVAHLMHRTSHASLAAFAWIRAPSPDGP